MAARSPRKGTQEIRASSPSPTRSPSMPTNSPRWMHARMSKTLRGAAHEVQRELVKVPERGGQPRRARGAAVAVTPRPAVQTLEVLARRPPGPPAGDEEVADHRHDQVRADPAAENAIAPDDEVHPEERAPLGDREPPGPRLHARRPAPRPSTRARPIRARSKRP